MDDPINIPTFNIFAFTAKCFIPFDRFFLLVLLLLLNVHKHTFTRTLGFS